MHAKLVTNPNIFCMDSSMISVLFRMGKCFIPGQEISLPISDA